MWESKALLIDGKKTGWRKKKKAIETIAEDLDRQYSGFVHRGKKKDINYLIDVIHHIRQINDALQHLCDQNMTFGETEIKELQSIAQMFTERERKNAEYYADYFVSKPLADYYTANADRIGIDPSRAALLHKRIAPSEEEEGERRIVLRAISIIRSFDATLLKFREGLSWQNNEYTSTYPALERIKEALEKGGKAENKDDIHKIREGIRNIANSFNATEVPFYKRFFGEKQFRDSVIRALVTEEQKRERIAKQPVQEQPPIALPNQELEGNQRPKEDTQANQVDEPRPPGIAITSKEWADARPEGYIPIGWIINRFAQAVWDYRLNLRTLDDPSYTYADRVNPETNPVVRMGKEWRELEAKAKTEGLTSKELKMIVELSQDCKRRVDEAIDTAKSMKEKEDVERKSMKEKDIADIAEEEEERKRLEERNRQWQEEEKQARVDRITLKSKYPIFAPFEVLEDTLEQARLTLTKLSNLTRIRILSFFYSIQLGALDGHLHYLTGVVTGNFGTMDLSKVDLMEAVRSGFKSNQYTIVTSVMCAPDLLSKLAFPLLQADDPDRYDSAKLLLDELLGYAVKAKNALVMAMSMVDLQPMNLGLFKVLPEVIILKEMEPGIIQIRKTHEYAFAMVLAANNITNNSDENIVYGFKNWGLLDKNGKEYTPAMVYVKGWNNVDIPDERTADENEVRLIKQAKANIKEWKERYKID